MTKKPIITKKPSMTRTSRKPKRQKNLRVKKWFPIEDKEDSV